MKMTHYVVKIVAPTMGGLQRLGSARTFRRRQRDGSGEAQSSRDYRVVRLRFSRAHLLFAITLALVAFGAVAGSYVWTIERAAVSAGALRSYATDQHARLRTLAAHASQLDGELRSLQRQNDAIERMIEGKRGPLGDTPSKRADSTSARARARAEGGDRSQVFHAGDDFGSVAARIERLRAGSMRVRNQSARLRRLALHVLNVRKLQDLARVRVLAAIPSLNPAGDGVAIRSPFGWRADPWPEFHAGVDLDVDYGDAVRAAAAGTVIAAGDGGDGYGIKVDIDHGNGYHTWYAHLSRAGVRPGQRVAKGQHIALVGSSGESTGPHLHYQVMLDGRAVDPSAYLDGIPAPVLGAIK